MRKLMLLGTAIAVAFGATAAVANVVVVKSLGPSSKAYPPGKTLPETAKISLQGGDILTVIGPSSAQTLRGPGSFDARQVALASAASQRGRFGALRAIDVAHNPSIWDIDVALGRQGVHCQSSEAPGVALGQRSANLGAGPLGRWSVADVELGGGQGVDGLACCASDQERRAIFG